MLEPVVQEKLYTSTSPRTSRVNLAVDFSLYEDVEQVLKYCKGGGQLRICIDRVTLIRKVIEYRSRIPDGVQCVMYCTFSVCSVTRRDVHFSVS